MRKDGFIECRAANAVYGIGLQHYTSVANYTNTRQCLAYSEVLTSKENKLCKNDTGLAAPSETETGYVRWFYQ